MLIMNHLLSTGLMLPHARTRTSSARSRLMMSGERQLPTLNWLRTLDTVVTRGLDTVEDALLLARRVAATNVDPIDCLAAWEDETDARPRLLVRSPVSIRKPLGFCLFSVLTQTSSPDPDSSSQIIGSGWGAHALTKIVDADLYRCLVVSPRTYFIFTPMLAASSVGTVEYRSITEPMRAANPRAAFLQGVVQDIDPMAREAAVCIGAPDQPEGTECQQLQYDICVYAAGVQASASAVPGVREHCRFLKELGDAQELRRAVADALERASEPGLSDTERRQKLTLVVVGGGPTGVEYCGELSDFLLDAVTRLYPALLPYAQVLLLHGGREVLPQFDPALRQQALAKLRDRGVRVMLNTRVECVTSPFRLEVREKSGETTSPLECGLIMWAAGTGPTRLTEALISRLDDCFVPADVPADDGGGSTAEAAETDDATFWADVWARQWFASGEASDPSAIPRRRSTPGRLSVDPWLRVAGAPSGSLIAIGDASACYSAQAEALLPQTAQVAAQQGAYVARLLNRGYDLSGREAASAAAAEPAVRTGAAYGCEVAGPPISHEAAAGDLSRFVFLRGAVEARPFAFLNLGLLAYLGGGEALSQVQVGENRLLSEAGSIGFLLWRSVYVVKQVSPRTRFLVLFDWFKTKLFGRDVTNW